MYIVNGTIFNPDNLSIIVCFTGCGWGHNNDSIYDDNSGADFTNIYKNYINLCMNYMIDKYGSYDIGNPYFGRDIECDWIKIEEYIEKNISENRNFFFEKRCDKVVV